jgi:hypothetical protein
MEHLVRFGNLLVDLDKRFSEPVDTLLKTRSPVVWAVGLFRVDRQSAVNACLPIVIMLTDRAGICACRKGMPVRGIGWRSHAAMLSDSRLVKEPKVELVIKNKIGE